MAGMYLRLAESKRVFLIVCLLGEAYLQLLELHLPFEH